MGPGGFDMQQIFAAAQQAMSAQQELANSEVIGTAGGGAVRAVVSGVGPAARPDDRPERDRPADPAESAATIADLVLAAVRDAWDSAVDLQQRQLGALGGGGFGGAPGGFGEPPGGFDLSSLGLPNFGGELGLAYAGEDDEDDDDEDFETTRTTTRTTSTTRTRRTARPTTAQQDPEISVARCMKASSSTSSTSSAGCPASGRRARSGSRSTCSPPTPRTSGGWPPRSIEVTERVRFCKTCGNVAEARGVPDLPGHPAGSRGDLRRRGAQGRRRGGEDP